MPCMAYCPMIPKRQLSFDENPLASIMIRWQRRYIVAQTTTYCSIAYPVQRHTKRSRKPLMVYVAPISQFPSLKIDCDGLVITGQQWLPRSRVCKMVQNLSNPCRFHTPNPEVTPPHSCFMALWGIGNWRYRTISSPSTRGHRFILAITDYFLVTKAILLAKVKTISVNNFIKHNVIHWFSVPRRIIHDNDPQFISQSLFQFCHKYRI